MLILEGSLINFRPRSNLFVVSLWGNYKLAGYELVIMHITIC